MGIKIKLITNHKAFFVLFILSVIYSSCEDNKYDEIQKYQRPDWLVGKLYTQINNSPELSMFSQCLVDIGFDELVNRSGTYTAFAPSNDAFQQYMTKKSYTSVEDIPLPEKERIVKSHIIQFPYSKDQLTGLSASGWIDENDGFNNEPLAFKRQTLMRNPNKKYFVKEELDGSFRYVVIVDEAMAEGERVVYTDSRKYVSLFYDGFLNASELNGSDYEFYFNRPYEAGNIFFADSKVLSDEIYADNGVVYVVDRVIEPLLNAEELMIENNYTLFNNLINQYSEFEFNQTATDNQEGADEGVFVDPLFNLSFRGIGFDINKEIVQSAILNLEYHYGIVVPSNAATQSYIDSAFLGDGRWSNFDEIPSYTKQVFINAHISQEPIFLSDINSGYLNELGNKVSFDENKILTKTFGSNCTFIGLDGVIEPKAFTSVSSPLFLSSDYQSFLTAFDASKLLDFLTNNKIEFSLFLIDDKSIGSKDVGGDESLITDWIGSRKIGYKHSYFDNTEGKYINSIEKKILEQDVLGQTGVQPVLGEAKIEYVETLDGRHIILDHVNKTVTGGRTSVFGRGGTDPRIIHFEEEGDYDNGQAIKTNGWLNFTSSTTFSQVNKRAKFLNLLKKAGLADDFVLKFIQPSERYTLFIPSDSAIDEMRLDTLSVQDLRIVLNYHIVRDQLIFTDGRLAPDSYTTLNTQKKMFINPKPDVISVRMSDGEVVDIHYELNKTNIIGTRNGSNGYPVTQVVIHYTSKVLN